MKNWKIINRIALAFGVVFLLFAGLAAFINYEITKLQYPGAPDSFVELNFLWAMLPFIALAVLSFVVSNFISRAMSSNEEEEMQEEAEEAKEQAKEATVLNEAPS